MMEKKQADALQLADELDNTPDIQMRARCVAAELRRLQAENERLKTLPMKYRRMEFNAQLQTENDRLRAQRDELLGLLNEVRMNFTRDDDLPDDILPRIDAAIAKAEGRT